MERAEDRTLTPMHTFTKWGLCRFILMVQMTAIIVYDLLKPYLVEFGKLYIPWY